jgi:hypothetical protein
MRQLHPEMTLRELQNLMLANLVFIFKIILKLLITLNFYGLRVDVPVWDKGL